MDDCELIISTTLEKIHRLLSREDLLLDVVDKQLKLIQRELQSVKAFVEERKLEQYDDQAKAWVADVIAVACDVENAVEMVELEAKRRPLIGLTGGKLDDMCVPLRNIGAKIKKIKKHASSFGLKSVAEDSAAYLLKKTMEKPKKKTGKSSTAGWSIDDSCFSEICEGDQGPSSLIKRLREYGRSAALSQGESVIDSLKDADLLVQRLTSGDKRCGVVSIVAPGGAGKTTLAHTICKLGDVKNYFDVTAWITLYWCYELKNYVAEELLPDIAEQVMDMPKQDAAQMNVEDLQRKLPEFLKEKRFLIVLDNLWNKDAWDLLKEAFPDGKNGSRIMLTTRNMEVARHANRNPANPPYKLPLLTPEGSWKLFLKKAFPWMAGDITCPAQLEDIGKEIVAECMGSPLAIKVIGGLVAAREEGNVMDWKLVLESLKLQRSQGSENYSKIPVWGYYDLPCHLKQCFLYLGLFPPGRQINVEKLMMLWVAEGFIQPREGQSKEDTAKEYFMELTGRSMIQVTEMEWDGEAVTCCIDYLLYELLWSETYRGGVSQVSDHSTNWPRRVAVCNKLTPLQNSYSSDLRSFLCFTQSISILNPLSTNSSCLRVLDLEGVKINEITLDFLMKTHLYLKYLNLSGTSIKSLPPSIGNLYSLEILILDYNTRLPEEIWKLNRLGHLYALDCEFEGLPQVERLKNLHTLCLTVGDWIEYNSLSLLSSLRILKLAGDIGSHLQCLWDSIKELTDLQSLVLSDSSIEAEDQIIPYLRPCLRLYEMVLAVKLESLPRPDEFPPNLTRLVLDGSGLEEDPMPILEKLANLQILQLNGDAYQGKKMISSAGGFPKLICLAFLCMNELEEWIVEEGAMPKLVHLSISVCRNLNMLPEGLRFITTLKEFETWDISKKLYDRLQKSQGEDWYKIQNVTYLRISK